MGKIIIAGIGPGSKEDITPAVLEAVRLADAIVGYKYYFQFIEPYVKDGCQCIDTGMKKERERAEQAFLLAETGKTVVVISSGDAGLYGMAPLVYEMAEAKGSDIIIETLPGISAFQKAASLLGAPIGHDTCIISLSDLMTPWEVIERRIKAAATGDFVTAVYNPKSHGRYWQLYRLQELFLMERSADTPVGYVRQAGRPEQEVKVTTLGAFDPEDIDMFTVVLIGNSQSYIADGKMITPRGYYRATATEGEKIGQNIMIESFRTIASEVKVVCVFPASIGILHHENARAGRDDDVVPYACLHVVALQRLKRNAFGIFADEQRSLARKQHERLVRQVVSFKIGHFALVKPVRMIYFSNCPFRPIDDARVAFTDMFQYVQTCNHVSRSPLAIGFTSVTPQAPLAAARWPASLFLTQTR